MTKTPRRAGASLLLAVAGLVAACGGTTQPASPDAANAMPREASVRLGDVVVRATAIPTTTLGEAVAVQYGIVRDHKTVMLLVGVRRARQWAQETALPAQVTASATDLLGKRQAIAMRAVRTGGLVDYVGVATVIPPDTLRFDINALPEGGQRMTLRFNRDFFAQ